MSSNGAPLAAEAIISGGSFVGLAMAQALVARGHRVIVVERRPMLPAYKAAQTTDAVAADGPARVADRPDHWGLMLWPPAIRVLKWLGLGSSLEAIGEPVDALHFSGVHESFGGVTSERFMPLGGFFGVLPSELSAVLLSSALAAGVVVLDGATIKHARRQAGGVQVTLEDGRAIDAKILIGADGAESIVRRQLRIPALFVRVPRQEVLTTVAGSLGRSRMVQVLGEGWTLSSIPLSKDRSWVNACVMGSRSEELARHFAFSDQAVGAALGDATRWASLIRLRLRTAWLPRWEEPHALLVGDAAHPILPHLGLGGSIALEDVPIATEVVSRALRSGDLSSKSLAAFRLQRRTRVAYATRVSLAWAAFSPGAPKLLRPLRDSKLNQLRSRHEVFEHVLLSVAAGGVPRFSDRWTTGLI